MANIFVRSTKDQADQFYQPADPNPGLPLGTQHLELVNLELLPGVNGLIVGTSCIYWGPQGLQAYTGSLANWPTSDIDA
ncbi:uncharacterized protein N7473_001107 [Penicillium subrubescens]|uniref:Uncharacterized protein n=1 Tax=Penicillium subrubescens TaxID=1316194 RepID=A0A1Q5UJ35_9EURO|nr:uncharacterized protein N7473_001107 [Penicillium subrubescens]KAJ5911804.1 hypothetical protein N7473_001107 [Penicillium subrubescens]OKP12494.1 hypothetical protein PENSUB_1860 [Penicillium subrubescens]